MSVVLKVDLDELIAGRQLSFPIYDDHQTLLLAAGSPITAENIERIRNRGIQHVLMDEADVANATLSGRNRPQTEADQELEAVTREHLETFLASGMMRTANTGPALKQRVVQQTDKPHDPKLQQTMSTQRRADADAVDRIMDQIAGGEQIAVEQLAQVSDTGIHDLIADCEGTLDVILAATSDPTLADHAVSASILAMAIGIELGLDENNIRDIGLIGLVHDLGMLAVPVSIREARHVLSPSEFLEIQKHPLHTVRMLENIPGLPKIAKMVALQVHERPNGSGYPSKKRGNTIHPFAKVLHVADAYTAMTSVRPFRRPMMPYVSMECLLRQANCHQVDADVVRSLLEILSLFPVGSFVALSDGSAARVLRPNRDDYTKPLVALVQDSSGNNLDPNAESSLLDLAKSELQVVQALPTPGRNEIGLEAAIAVQTV